MKKFMNRGAFVLLAMMTCLGFCGCEKEDDNYGGGDGTGGFKESKLHKAIRGGLPLEGAAAYKTKNPSPIAVLAHSFFSHEYPMERLLPKEWIAESTKELELVCIYGPSQRIVIQRATYLRYASSISLERVQHKLPLVLKEAATGRVVAQTTLVGGIPRAFQQTETGDVSGDGPDSDDIEAWLRPFIER